MKKEYKIFAEIIGAAGTIFALYKGGLIGQESAIIIGVNLFALILCFQNLRQEIKDDLNNLREETKKGSNKLREDLNIIRNALAEIQKYLMENFNFLPLHKIAADKYGVENSPMRPNDEGQRLLKESGFNELYPKVKENLFTELDGMKTRTLYDAEENAKTALNKLSRDPLFDDVKHYAVNHHHEPLELIFTVGAWIIRDDYGKEKGISK